MSWPTSKQSDNTRIFSNGDHDITDYDLHDFPYVVAIGSKSLPYSWTQWCKDNCTSHWAWWFDADQCYVGFGNNSDAIWFSLKFIDIGVS